MKPRKLAALFLAALLCLSLAGCHGKKGAASFTVPEDFDPQQTYEITFWAKNDTNKAQTDIYRGAIEGFQNLYPNITVSLRLYTDYGKIYNDVITNISTGTTPNVCITYPDHIATYLSGANVIAPLDGLLASPVFGPGGSAVRYAAPAAGEIVEKFLDECAIDGVQYALPYMRSTEACYVNKTYVQALGFTLPDVLTWDFVWQVAEAAMAKNPDGTFALNGQNVMIPFIYKSTDNMMIQYLRQAGAGYATAAGDIELFNDTTKSLLKTVYGHAATGAFSTFKISSYPANFLNAGQCIFAVDSTAGATWMGSGAPLSDISADKFVEFETAVLPVPQVDPSDPAMISQGPSVCVFNKDDPGEVAAAWLFAQYLLTDDVQTAYAETEGYVPVTTRARNSPEYLDYLSRAGEDAAHYAVKIAASRLLLDNTEHTFVTPVFNGSASLRDAAGQLIENVTKAARRGQSIEGDYFDGLFADVTSLYRLDRAGGGGAQGELGPLPGTSVALLCALGAAWVLMGGLALWDMTKSYKMQKNSKKH